MVSLLAENARNTREGKPMKVLLIKFFTICFILTPLCLSPVASLQETGDGRSSNEKIASKRCPKIPSGSYQQSCYNISLVLMGSKGECAIVATCATSEGSTGDCKNGTAYEGECITSYLLHYERCKNLSHDIANCNGQLTCGKCK